MEEAIQFTLNGKPVRVAAEGERKLLWVLRSDLGLTGSKCGCNQGYCGACTVLMNDEAVRSCSIYMEDVAGKKITTIEGLAPEGKLHPVQQAFVDHDALQCGYCTPGMIMNAVGLLKKKPHPTREEIITGMEDNFCRCGAHIRIVAAIEEAAGKM